MGGASRWEYLKAIHQRYRKATKELRGMILDEFCSNCGYARKYAIRLLNGPPPGKARPPRKKRRSIYGSQLVSILEAIWAAAGYPWSYRLKALLPQWLPQIRKRFRLTPELERQLLRISPRQIDRRLADRKLRLRKRIYGRTKPGTLLKHHIPIKTDSWDVTVPGFTEVDLVSHSGNSAEGEFIYSLNVTDIHTTWVETRAVLGKAQSRIVPALDDIRRSVPFELKGIDADNGSEFINNHLYRNELRLFQNLFLPSVKLVQKVRVGSRVKRVYDKPQTPIDRVCASLPADHPKLAELQKLRDSLDPFALSQAIDEKLDRILRMASVRHSPRPPGKAEINRVKDTALQEVTKLFGIPITDRSRH